MNKTAITWADYTWNPILGCSAISPACARCYAATGAHVKASNPHPRVAAAYADLTRNRHWSGLVRTLPERLEQPLRVSERRAGTVFVCSMSDLFHASVPEAFLRQVFAIMEQAHWHTFLVLTKRADRLAYLAPSLPWPRNVWAGVTIESEAYLWRADMLRQVPVHNDQRFLSVEPMLDPLHGLSLDGLRWVIVGGESGSGFRPLQEPWVADLHRRCTLSRVGFHFKQWGGNTPRARGRLLDGRTWDCSPPELSPLPVADRLDLLMDGE